MATTANHLADKIHSVTSKTFDTLVLAGTGPIAVEFMSYGCVHCRAIEPALQAVAERIAGTESIFRINIAIEDELATTYDVTSTPTFVMFLNGAEVGRVVGPKPNVQSVLRAVTQMFES
jgi:thioredoxin 1